jgi:hypothetical protein
MVGKRAKLRGRPAVDKDADGAGGNSGGGLLLGPKWIMDKSREIIEIPIDAAHGALLLSASFTAK